MSGKLVGEVLRYAPDDLGKLDLLVLVSLAESARERDRTARADTACELLAARVRSTPGSVRNALGRLRDRALIRPARDGSAGIGRAQQWTLTELSDHHRGATIHHLPVSPGSDTTTADPGPRRVTGE